MGGPNMYEGVDVVNVGGSTSSIAGSVVELVSSGPGCAVYQAVTANGVRANTGTVGHFQRVIGITRQALPAGVAATLDCGTLAAGAYDAIVAADPAGVLGNLKSLRLVGDSPPAGGVTAVVVGNAMVVHYESGVSTPAQVDAAIVGIIVIDTPATGVAALVSPADDFVATLLAGGADGAARQVVTHGKITNPAWTWNAGAPIYLNGNALSETDPVIAPGAGFNQQIGMAVENGAATTDTIDVDLGAPILA